MNETTANLKAFAQKKRKKIIKRMKRQQTEWEKKFSNYLSGEWVNIQNI